MSIHPKVDKPDPTQNYVVLMPFVNEKGTVIRAGMKLSGDHPAVVEQPWCFIPDGTDDETRQKIMAERFPI